MGVAGVGVAGLAGVQGWRTRPWCFPRFSLYTCRATYPYLTYLGSRGILSFFLGILFGAVWPCLETCTLPVFEDAPRRHVRWYWVPGERPTLAWKACCFSFLPVGPCRFFGGTDGHKIDRLAPLSLLALRVISRFSVASQGLFLAGGTSFTHRCPKSLDRRADGFVRCGSFRDLDPRISACLLVSICHDREVPIPQNHVDPGLPSLTHTQHWTLPYQAS